MSLLFPGTISQIVFPVDGPTAQDDTNVDQANDKKTKTEGVPQQTSGSYFQLVGQERHKKQKEISSKLHKTPFFFQPNRTEATTGDHSERDSLYGTHKNLYIYLFLLTIFGHIYYNSPP